jgi:hypothetical protein
VSGTSGVADDCSQMNDGIDSGDRFGNNLGEAKITQKKFKTRMGPNAEQGVSAVGENIDNADVMIRRQQPRD